MLKKRQIQIITLETESTGLASQRLHHDLQKSILRVKIFIWF